jgi:uncharacterized membrane protein
MADVTLNALIRTNADIVAWLDSRSKWPMDRADVSFWLSVTGFATSTVLAIIKGVEFYAARRIVFTADTRLTNNREIGNTIVLLNKSNIPTTISNWYGSGGVRFSDGDSRLRESTELLATSRRRDTT